jgi:radial spoke head protein 9
MLATMNNNALLTLDALAGCGVVLPAEIRASLDVSLALKASELGVREFFLWGRVRTQSGTDYYVARAENGKRVDHDGVVVANVGAKFYYSQDGMEWLDLVPPEEDVTMEKAAELKCASSSVDRSRVLDLFILAGRRAPRLR